MKRFRIALGLSFVLIAGLATTLTRGGRGYFAPETLEFEVQSEYTLVYGAISIYRSKRQAVSYPLLDYLRQSGHMQVLPGPPRKWDEEFHWNHAWKDGYSDFHRALTRRSDELIEWSQADPERARLFWSTFFRWKRSTVERENWAANDLLSALRRCRTVDEVRLNISEIETYNGLPHSEHAR